MIQIKAGGYRHPESEETKREKVVDDYGNIRSDEHGFMDGENVFSFVAREVPKDLKKMCSYAGCRPSQIDYFLFHQASRVINDFLRKKLKLEESRVPSSLHQYGNTSSVSIPLTIVSTLKAQLKGGEVLCLSGFGVGLSWGSVLVRNAGMYIADIVEV